MNQISTQRSTPITRQTAMLTIRPLFTALPLPRGLDADTLMDGYLLALDGLALDALKAVVLKIMRGTMAEQPKFCPRPPELAQMVRAEEVRQREASRPSPVLPASNAFKDWREIHKRKASDEGRKLIHPGADHATFISGVKRGEYPAGSVWYWSQGVYGPATRGTM